MAQLGRLDIVLGNAGVFEIQPSLELSDGAWQEMIDINLTGVWNTVQFSIPHLIEAGGGSIMNCSSVEGLGGMPTLVAYTGTKFAIRGMTKAAAMELGPQGIRVNSVHPGVVDTGMTRGYAGEEGMRWAAKRVALKRVGTPDDIAPMYVFLASDESSFVTGATLSVDGGMSD